MPYKSFKAPDGNEWSVWPVFPTSAERRRSERRAGAASAVGYAGPERRRTPDRRLRAVGTRAVVTAGFENGWLCFESDEGEKRRLVPVPDTWEKATPDKLWLWCRAAISVTKCSPR